MYMEDVDYSKEFVLLVDDEESVRLLVSAMLSHLRFQHYVVSSALDAMRELTKKTHTLLLTDIKLPDKDGLELIRHTREEYPDVCIIAMTGYATEYAYIDVINAGATDFINKPFIVEELEAKLKRALIERNIRWELSRLSVTDPLTGLYNQRQFYSRLKDEMIRAERQNSHLSLIMMDLDDFKKFNDQKGHLAGDEILKEVGSIINEKIRQGVDSAYRYGGDEFSIILISDMDGGTSTGMRIEEAIYERCGLHASLGCAEFKAGMSPKEFVSVADKDLYRLKDARKDTHAKNG